MTFDANSNMITNSDGLSWVGSMRDQITELKAKFDEFQKESNSKHDKLQDKQDRLQDKYNSLANELLDLKRSYFSIRAADIQKNGDYVTKKTRQRRNKEVHGANILKDLEILDFWETQNLSVYDSTKKGFDAWYGVSLKRERDRIRSARKPIIDAFNQFADTKICDGWNDDPKGRKETVRICRSIIDSWRSYMKTSGASDPSDKTTRKYNEKIKKKHMQLTRIPSPWTK